MNGRYGIADPGATASTQALLFALIMLSGPFAFETVLLTMAIWPAFADSVRRHKIPTVVLSIFLGAVSLSEWSPIIREWSVLGMLGVSPKFASDQLDSPQNVAYAAQFGFLAYTPWLQFSYDSTRQARATAEQILCAAAFIFPVSVAIKWSHFVHPLPIEEGINRWGIRIFGSPNSEMTTLVLVAFTVAGGFALASAAYVIRSSSQR